MIKIKKEVPGSDRCKVEFYGTEINVPGDAEYLVVEGSLQDGDLRVIAVTHRRSAAEGIVNADPDNRQMIQLIAEDEHTIWQAQYLDMIGDEWA